jgi:uncharacterized protein
MIHPNTELGRADERIGLGVFATRFIPKGTIVWVLDELDQRLTPERVRRLGRSYQGLLDRYGYKNAAGEIIVCWDFARWVNHCCEANAVSTPWDFDIAVRDIAPGEEITNDYAALNIAESFTCHCGLDTCRGTVRPEDFDVLADRWDLQVRDAIALVSAVPQPLWTWVRNRRLVRAAGRDPRRLPSVRSHRLDVPTRAPLRTAVARPT